jgi:methionyl-tRNA formyltransferase
MVNTATRPETRTPAPAMPPLRIVFFGTPAFAVPSLDALLRASPHTVVGVVTQPDRPRGRGHKLSDAPVKARAVDAGLPVLQPERMKDPAFLDALAAWGADLGVVAAYGRILTDAILATPRLGMINVHASLLPRYRGAAPVHRAVIAGDTSTGVTIMRVVKALDAGGMFVKEQRPIGPDETSDEVERALAQIGARLLVAVVDQIARGSAEETPQNDAESTYAHRLTREDGAIDWSWPAARVHNLIRGLHPWPHAFSVVQGKRVILRRSGLETPGPKGPGLQTNGVGDDVGRVLLDPPGTILEADGDRLIVATGEGALRILEIQAEGKRPMPAREFLAGHRLTAGDRFTEMVRLPPSPSDGSGGTRKPDTDAP